MINHVTINLDKPRKLRFGMGASVEFEELTGINLMADKDKELSYTMAAKLLWVMLKQEEKSLTLKDTLNLVDDHAESIDYVLDKIGEALQSAMGGTESPKVPTAK